jgi:protein disulfide isomerase
LVYPPPRFVSDKYEKKRARFPGKALEAEALKKFMYKKSVPLVGQKTWKSGERYDKQGVPVVTLFAAVDLEKNAKGYEYFANRARKVAADFVGKLSFNIGDKEDFSYQLEDYDLSLDGKKDVGVGAKDGNKYYKMDDKFNVDNLRAFAEALVAGSLTPKVKEEPDYSSDYDEDGPADDGPADYEGSDVAQLTTDNYAELTDGKDAMLEFYAPWCGHCQSLKPVYKELGTALATEDSVVVGAMDATANEPPEGIEVQGYPTLIFKKASGETMPYDGERDVESMVAFIKDNADADVKVEL